MYEIAAVRTGLSEDGTHPHVEQIGYISPHTPEDEIFIDIPRLLQRLTFGESFGTRVGDEMVAVSASKCPVCGFEPYLKTPKDTADTQHLLALPRK